MTALFEVKKAPMFFNKNLLETKSFIKNEKGVMASAPVAVIFISHPP
jgi:hypothetical protein